MLPNQKSNEKFFSAVSPDKIPIVSVVVPCYNEETAILLFYKDALSVLDRVNKSYELIFVDDGSNDNTLTVLRQLAKQDSSVHFISFSRNFGKEAAILAGLTAAQGEYIAILDADGQDPPSLISEMLDAVISGECDCAAARRVNRIGEPPVRSLFARFFYKFMKKIAEIEVVDGARDFRLMNRKYLNALLELPERNRFSKGIFPWVGFNIKWFEMENIKRKTGRTKWSFSKLFRYSLDGIIAFSTKPLVLASAIGILLFVIAIAFIIFIIIRKIVLGDPVSGWASTVCIILFCSGFQLLTIGILGQYVAKIYTETKQRPHYIIREME